MPKNKQSNTFCPTRDEIDLQVQRILTSPDFRITPQQTAFLNYVVEQTLAGKADRIKGYTVATEVFGRRSDFDQNIDPIVSIQAARLRRALVDYYQGAGRHDPLRIDIPKGSYVPQFIRQGTGLDDTATGSQDIVIHANNSWPSVFVAPLKNLSANPDLASWGAGLATEIAHELNRYPDIRVLTLNAIDLKSQANTEAVRFKIHGSVRGDNTAVKITVQLTDTRSGRLIWSQADRLPLETAGIIAIQEKIARSVAVKIAGEHGHIAKAVASGIKRRPPQQMEVYEAILSYYEYDLNLTPETFSKAMAALDKAVRIDPECGQAWAMRARLLADMYALDSPGFQNPLATSLEFAQNGVRLVPGDQRASTILAFVYLLYDDLPAGRLETERALRLGPNTLFMLDDIGYLMTLLGDWQRGPELIRKTIQLNPFYSNYVHYALWVDCLRRKDYEGAYRETLKLNQPALFWEHLARASTFGLRGDIEEGRRSAAQLLDFKPDFHDRGRFLIGNYIKFETIAEQVIKGLAAVGIEVR